MPPSEPRDASAPPQAAPRRLHPVDLLALVLALLAGAAAWAFLFRAREAPRPVDPILGGVLSMEFAADLPWKRDFLAPGQAVLLDEALRAEVVAAGPAPSGREGFRGVRLRVRGLDAQDPDARASFRWGIWKGTRMWIRTPEEAGPVATVEAEVVAVEPAEGP